VVEEGIKGVMSLTFQFFFSAHKIAKFISRYFALT